MRTLLLLMLVGSALTQTTTHKPNIFQSLGSVFSTTFDSLTDALGDYLKSQGTNLLHNLLPSLAGEFLQSGLWSLVDAAIHPGGTPATGKRNIAEDLESLKQSVQLVLHQAEAEAEDIKHALQSLVGKVLTGQLSLTEFQQLVPKFQEIANELLSKLREGVLTEVHKLAGNKRELLDLSLLTHLLQGLETQGQAVFGQVLQEIQALANPGNLLSLLTEAASKLGLTNVLGSLAGLIG
ncbi:hypothetical protein C0Q70_21605 [Pomacea canaliculata]|uniref:Uncharacterized protein n=1 Tax=Pomacea canaliculata TaxID=400727 RepID=A0A2T7NCZ8_POMCA|nr:uncharacterized protein LOC112555800 [Pomacea canaliculata]PVD19046.1 hypothetical protein C0Q70_21605 [Pomacea canaliculata]